MDFIIEINGKQFVDIVKILPERTSVGYKILWKKLDDKLIEVYVDKRGFEGGSRAKSILVKRCVPLSELLFEGLGLFIGDGLKLSQGQFKVYGFANNQLMLHKHFLNFSEICFGLSSYNFNARIEVPPKLQNKIEEIKSDFSRELNIPLENFQKSRIEDVNKPCLQIKFCSILLGTLIQLLFEKLKFSLFENKNFIAGFLRGLIAAEGCVSLGVKNRLEIISIGAKEKNERDFIRELLLSLEIIPNKNGKETVLVSGLSNFKIMRQFELCALHPEKFKKFVSGLKKIKHKVFRKYEGKLLILKLLSIQTRTVRELCKILKRTPDTIKSRHLIDLEKLGLVKRKGRVNNCRIWRITKEGLNLLEERNPLERMGSVSLSVDGGD